MKPTTRLSRLITLLLLLQLGTLHSFAQNDREYTGWMAQSYSLNSTTAQTINQPISITYNPYCCSVSVGGKTIDFITDAYHSEYANGYIRKTFLNRANDKRGYGWYGVEIREYKDGTASFIISCPMIKGGYTYQADNAISSSADGKAHGKIADDITAAIEARAKGHMKKAKFYIGGAPSAISLDSVVTKGLVDKYQVNANQSIGDVTVDISIDANGKVSASNLVWGMYATNMGFSQNQMVSIPGTNQSKCPVSKDEYAKQLLAIVGSIPNVTPILDDMDNPVSVTAKVQVHVGSKN